MTKEMRELSEQLSERLIKHNGVKQQLLQSVEETTELNKEILKYIRYQDGKYIPGIIEELGDVFNALETLIRIFGIDVEELDKKRFNKVFEYCEKNQI